MKMKSKICIRLVCVIGVIFIISSASASMLQGYRWQGFYENGLDNGINQVSVQSFVTYNDNLIVGGNFNRAGEVSVNNVAQWDGSEWTSLGSGVNCYVMAMTVYNGNLIVGGRFWEAGGQPANGIACWDGESWSALGSGISGAYQPMVMALVEYNGDLIAGGLFHNAGEEVVNYIARWDGSEWHAMGPATDPGFNNVVDALIVYNGELIAAGGFIYAGPNDAYRIAKWDEGSQEWTALDPDDPYNSGMTGYADCIQALEIYNGDLIAGGYFFTTSWAQHIARWDGSIWHPMDGLWLEGYDGFEVNSLAVFCGELVVGGTFDIIYGYPHSTDVNYIASWNGETWNPLGSGMANPTHPEYQHATVYALGVYGHSLFAGGNFQSAGGQPTKYIARWYHYKPPQGAEPCCAAPGPYDPESPWE